MSMRFTTIRALFKKDIKDALKNGQYMLLAVLPLLFTALYRFLDFGGFQLDQSYVMTLGLLMNISLIPISMTSMMIAEEKEKNTLRTLMLANVSAAEFLISKALVIYLITQSVNLIIYLLTGGASVGFPLFLLFTSLGCICLMFFGGLIGIISKNQMSTGMLSAPLALLMLMPAIFAQIHEGFAKFARFTPTYAMMNLLTGSSETALSILVLLVWIVLAATLFGLTYQRKRLD